MCGLLRLRAILDAQKAHRHTERHECAAWRSGAVTPYVTARRMAHGKTEAVAIIQALVRGRSQRRTNAQDVMSTQLMNGWWVCAHHTHQVTRRIKYTLLPVCRPSMFGTTRRRLLSAWVQHVPSCRSLPNEPRRARGAWARSKRSTTRARRRHLCPVRRVPLRQTQYL